MLATISGAPIGGAVPPEAGVKRLNPCPDARSSPARGGENRFSFGRERVGNGASREMIASSLRRREQNPAYAFVPMRGFEGGA